MDNLSISSGYIDEAIEKREQSMLPQNTRAHNEMTHTRLRRLSKAVMSRSERLHFENRSMQWSNIIRYLEEHLIHSSDQIRSLALELLCCTIPRLANKTDCLLKPLLPKVFRCLKKNKSKELKIRALHFLRGYFQHTRRLSRFIDRFIQLGIENRDSGIQISCCLGLNIIFDQDVGNSLYSQLVIPVANLLMQRNKRELTLAAYRALKCIHKTVNNARFSVLMDMAHSEAAARYKHLFEFEEIDPFLTMEDNDCNTVVLEYQIKRNYYGLDKDFGILDPNLLRHVLETRNWERARAVINLFLALRQTRWTAEDLDQHILDFLKVIKSFASDTNWLVQTLGFDVLKEVINRMSFAIAPHIHWVIEILQKGLTSTNNKIKVKVYRVLCKLMRTVHPMTVVWNLLNTRDTSLKPDIILFVQNILSHFPYHKIDMIALCNYFAHILEDENSRIAKYSKSCLILLLHIIRKCPEYGIETEAINILLTCHDLSTQTLKDIGIVRHVTEDEYDEHFKSYSEEETTDKDTSCVLDKAIITTGTASSRRSLSKASESENESTCSELRIIKKLKILCEDMPYVHSESDRVLLEEEASNASIVISHESISTAGQSDARYSHFATLKSICEPVPCHYLHEEGKSVEKEPIEQGSVTTDADLHSFCSSQRNIAWGKDFEPNAREDETIKSSSTIKEELSTPNSMATNCSSTPSFKNDESNFSINNLPNDRKCVSSADVTLDHTQDSSHELKETEEFNLCETGSVKSISENCALEENYKPGMSECSNISIPDDSENLQSLDCGKGKYFTRFCLKPEINHFPSHPEKQAGGDMNSNQGSNMDSNQGKDAPTLLPESGAQKNSNDSSLTGDEKKEVERSRNNHCEEVDKSTKETNEEISANLNSCMIMKQSSTPNWIGCQWRRELEYASKAVSCAWMSQFEATVMGMKPFSSTDVAENEMKEAIEDLHGNSWTKKEEAMLIIIQIAKYHPEFILENTCKIAFVLCNEVNSFRQSVAAKAILTIGYIYEIMGKHFENKLRLVIAALLGKSGNRTLAGYYRLVVKSLFKVMNSSPQKAALAFIHEGSKHANKAAREIAAQFLTIFTENLGPDNSLAPTLSSHMLKCACAFAFDSSALTRYCGKRMLKIFLDHPDFEKIKERHLDFDTAQSLSRVLDQIKSKGVGEGVLPINLIN